jgi:hypothetical protein
LLNVSEAFSESHKNKDTKELVNKSINEIIFYIKENISNYLGITFPTVETEVSSGLTNSVTGGITVVTPLSNSKNIHETIFLQGSFFLTNEDRNRQTLNIGLSDRFLIMNEQLLVGLNSFYTQEFPYDHKRASIGIEAVSNIGEINLNKYYRLSTWNTGYNNIQEKTLDGLDINVGIALPHMNWTKVYLKKFRWENASNESDLKGDQFSLKTSLPYGFAIEIGKKSYSTANNSDENFFKLTWNLTLNEQNNFSLLSDDAYSLSSMQNRRYTKVKNENFIQKTYARNISSSGVAALPAAGVAALPAGYITLAGLTWAPITTTGNYDVAQATCAGATHLGFPAGTWRTATGAEILALNNLISKADLIAIHGWNFAGASPENTWTSVAHVVYKFDFFRTAGTTKGNQFNILCVKIP